MSRLITEGDEMPATRPNCQPAATRNWRWLLRLGLLTAVALAVLALGQGAIAPAAGQTPPAGGSVSGYVFHDLDRDGVRDEGEPGLSRRVQLLQNDNLIGEDDSDGQGAYLIEGVPAGEYTLTTELDDAHSFCSDGPFPNFNPLVYTVCSGIIPRPWHATTPEQTGVSVTAGDSFTLDIGGWPFDQSVLVGRAILDGDYASPGTTVAAHVGQAECGSTSVGAGGSPSALFSIVILGAAELEGCPDAGDVVHFRVGGVEASTTAQYVPQINQVSPASLTQDVVAMPNHAWYWAQQDVEELPPAGTSVEAVIDGEVCGEAELETQSARGIPLASGFFRLVVPSEALQPGCGRPGAVVSFTADGVASKTTVQWEAGVQRVTFDLPPPTPSPTPSPTASLAPSPSPATLPSAGGRQGSGESIPSVALVSVGLLTAVVLTMLFPRTRWRM